MMTTRFVEGHLLFEFDTDRWAPLFRWDRHPDFLNGIDGTHLGKAVDFVGILDNRVPYLIEVKDFRYHARDPEKMSRQEEFELKIRTTVAGLFGLRRQEPARESAVAWKTLHDSRKPRVVLWQEDAAPELGHGSRTAQLTGSNLAVLREQITKQLRWLNADAFVTSSADAGYGRAVPGLVVKDLPRERKQKAEEVLAILKRRNKPIPREVMWQILDCETEAELDDLIARAPNVRDAWKLFAHRG